MQCRHLSLLGGSSCLYRHPLSHANAAASPLAAPPSTHNMVLAQLLLHSQLRPAKHALIQPSTCLALGRRSIWSHVSES
ncbi:hypothetical protein N431DRAFT_437594 [Stipitochalara longipes BDJ]|nr:hypothetical protein N431DRAFT_437594 [Stipitochalara longipes BDJ]